MAQRIVATTSYPLGVYYTNNDGSNWTFAPTDYPQLEEFRFTAMGEAGGTIIAGTDNSEEDVDPCGRAYLYRSIDGGATWTRVASFLYDENDEWYGLYWYTRGIAGDGRGNWIALSWDTGGWKDDGSVDGVYSPYMAKSTDDGVTWTYIQRPKPVIPGTRVRGQIGGDEFCQMKATSGGRWVAALRCANPPGGLFLTYSDDMFSTWNYATCSDPEVEEEFWSYFASIGIGGICDWFQVATDNAGNWVAVTSTEARALTSLHVRFFYSSNDGENWTMAADGVSVDDQSFCSAAAMSPSGVAVACLSKYSFTGSAYYLSRIMRSDDFGNSWFEYYSDTSSLYDVYESGLVIKGNMVAAGITSSDTVLLSDSLGGNPVLLPRIYGPPGDPNYLGSGLAMFGTCPTGEINVGAGVVFV